MSIYNYLRQVNLFSDLDDEELQTLAQKLTRRRFEDGELIFAKGDAGDALYIVEDGAVRVITYDEDGGEIVLNHLGKGEVFGEFAVIDRQPRSASTFAVGATILLALTCEDLTARMRADPDLALRIMAMLVSRIRHTNTFLERAIDWSKQLSRGDYTAALEQIVSPSDEGTVGQFVSAFAQMAQELQKRERALTERIMELSSRIDAEARDRQVAEITATDFFHKLQKVVKQRRGEKADG